MDGYGCTNIAEIKKYQRKIVLDIIIKAIIVENELGEENDIFEKVEGIY